MPKPKFWGNFQNRAGIPLLFRALDGVGNHRALYHIPNNIIFYLGETGMASKGGDTKEAFASPPFMASSAQQENLQS